MKEDEGKKKDNVIPFDTTSLTMEDILRSNGKTEEEIQEYLKAEEADSLLFEAYEAETEEEAVELAQRALEINPNNFDAQNLITQSEENPIKRLEMYKQTLKDAENSLKKEELFSEDKIGIFWGVIETRPYMRTRHNYILTLMYLGRYGEAILECEEMLKLCEGDNLGIRYLVIGMYALLERYEQAEKLYLKYQDDSAHMIYPLAIMYYKKGEYDKCNKMLKKLQKANVFLYDLLKKGKIMDCDNEEMSAIVETGMFQLGSKEEACFIICDFEYLLMSVPSYFEYVLD